MALFDLSNNDLLKELLPKALMLPGLVIGFTLHEWSHAIVANKLGDPTPKNQGRLSLNPIRHIDLLGFLMILLVGFGWAKPVSFDMRNLKKPARDSLLIALAGPLMNLLLGFLLICVMGLFYPPWYASVIPDDYLYLVLFYAAYMNVMLFVFNMIPLPPLDGSWIVLTALPDSAIGFKRLYLKYGMFALLALVLLPVMLNFDFLNIGRITSAIFSGIASIF